jgi:hypothetical protein
MESQKPYTFTEVDRVAFCAYLLIENDPPLRKYILPRFGARNFINVEMAFGKIFPVCPHGG